MQAKGLCLPSLPPGRVWVVDDGGPAQEKVWEFQHGMADECDIQLMISELRHAIKENKETFCQSCVYF